MGRFMEIPSEVVTNEPNQSYAYQAGCSMPYMSVKVFEETETGTLVTERIEMESEVLLSRLLDPITLNASKRSHQKNLEQLKAMLESAPAAAPV
ncbi:MAG: hypothetical protein WA996_11445 [Candidatus Promineifilaceae bacterium]